MIFGNDIQVYTICHDTPTRIKKSSFFLIPNGKNQRKPLFIHKTDIRIKNTPDFLILIGEMLLTRTIKTESVFTFLTKCHQHAFTLISAVKISRVRSPESIYNRNDNSFAQK